MRSLKPTPGYTLSGTKIRISDPTYADDIETVGESPEQCQHSIDAFQKALEWTKTMKAKAIKCRSLAFRKFRKEEKQTKFKRVQATQYSSFDPLLTIDNKAIKFIGHDDPPMFKYLGRYVQFNLKEDLIKKQFEQVEQNARVGGCRTS